MPVRCSHRYSHRKFAPAQLATTPPMVELGDKIGDSLDSQRDHLPPPRSPPKRRRATDLVSELVSVQLATSPPMVEIGDGFTTRSPPTAAISSQTLPSCRSGRRAVPPPMVDLSCR
ncbi:hypothetical protein TIFTF001_008624 [Ficus carica]|uniref:Uncharacterized protein n=1 Tax=Ficus carica TaxID=3494 RepID=A0AA88D0P9_FICCA|nr:hypothetical protein TIFTF001_008624 [Ficus carica]